MITPRESFLLTGKAPAWKTIVSSDAFGPACNHALLEFESEMKDPMNPTGLAQIIGARRVLEILQTIAEPITPPVTTKRESLHY
jgi:hypothetical protein